MISSGLKGVSFSVKHGETFGLIGPNGSGKSTLLKALAGVLCPDSEKVRLNGKIASFLELGVGFELDLTARENIIFMALFEDSKRTLQPVHTI